MLHTKPRGECHGIGILTEWSVVEAALQRKPATWTLEYLGIEPPIAHKKVQCDVHQVFIEMIRAYP